MYLIVGLGNHEKQYHTHRHNVGFMFVDYLLNEFKNSRFKTEHAQSSIIYHLSSKILLAKPQTFMNKSGIAVSKLMSFFKLEPTEQLIVVHDDLDIPLGKFHIQKGTGPLMHNGLSSIEQRVGTKDFWRVRIGIENRPVGHHISGEAYVLESFNPEEQKIIDLTLPKIFHLLKLELLKP